MPATVAVAPGRHPVPARFRVVEHHPQLVVAIADDGGEHVDRLSLDPLHRVAMRRIVNILQVYEPSFAARDVVVVTHVSPFKAASG